MFCVNCGKIIPDDSAVCGYCGAATAITVQPSTERPAAGDPQGYGNPQYNGGQPGYNDQPNNGGQPYYGGQPGYNGQPNFGNQPGYNGQPNFGNQPGYYGQPNFGNQPGYYGQPNYNGQPGNHANNQFKPDNKFNFWAFALSGPWALTHGLWDVAAVYCPLDIIGILLCLTGVGLIIYLPINFVASIFLGRNANYYYRLKAQQKIWTFQALQDPNLKRI